MLGEKPKSKNCDAVPVRAVLLCAVFGLPAPRNTNAGGDAEGGKFSPGFAFAESLDLNLADIFIWRAVAHRYRRF